MKKYLMTWYGTTDFRAPLGLEHTTGPVLGALLAEDYTDVVILGFTNADKTEPVGLNEKDAFQEKLAGIDNSDPAVARQFLECKAGNVTSEHVMKLQHIIRYFGGIEGRAILALCFCPNSKVVRKKIEDSKNLQAVSGNNLFKQLEKMIQSGGSPE